MAETSLAPAPTPPAPTPPTPAPAPEAPKGIAAAMSELDAGVEKLEKGSAAAPEPPKAEPSAPEPPKAPATPEPEIEPAWDKAPKHLRNAHFKFKRETEGRMAELEKKNKELEGKSVQSPEDLRKIKANEERIAALETQLSEREKTLAESDYARSAEFKRDHNDKINAYYADAVSEVKNLTIKFLDKDQNEVERPATEADFRALLNLQPLEQGKKIDELFGSSNYVVKDHIRQLKGMERAANAAIASAKEKAAERAKLSETENGNKSKAFKEAEAAAQADIEKLHPEYFAPDPANPEATKMFENGLKFFDETVTNSKNFTPQQLAERGVALRYFVAAFPRLKLLDTQQKAKITALETELAKFRKSSPGSASPGTGAGPVTEKPKGIKDMAAAFDTLKE